MRIFIPMVPPSPNELRRKYRNPFAYKRLREAWENSIAYGVPSAEVNRALKRQAIRKCVRVTISIFLRRGYDPDNLHGCLKPVLDAMKNVGFIKDDSKRWLELVRVAQYPSFQSVGNSTIIEIEDG